MCVPGVFSIQSQKNRKRNRKTKMKNIIIRIIALALVLVTAAVAFVSCGGDQTPATTPKPNNNSGDNTAVPVPDYDFMGNDISGFINLAEYKGLSFEVEPKVIITEEYFAEQIKHEIISYGQYNKITEGTVKDTDVVKIKYVGYMDGKKFEGGEGTADQFTIYNGGGFIEGFAEGIVGAEVGKEIDVNVTFPEDYHASDLAGKPAVFKVTVECIYEAKEMTDELVKELSGGKMTTYEEFKKQAWELMEKNAEDAYKNAKINAVWNHIMENTTPANLPEDVVKQYYDYIVYYYQQVATQYYMTFETFCSTYGITLDGIREEAETEFIYETAIYSIIKAENLTLTEEEYNEMLKEMADSYGVTTDYVLIYYTKAELEEMFLVEKACTVVVEWNTFTDKAAE